MISKFNARTFGHIRNGLLTAAVWAVPLESAHAYVGPGLGATTIIVILGFLGSLLLAFFGIFWYPIKRVLKKRNAGKESGQRSDDPDSAGEHDTP